jgi:protein-L-isoaspartate(D-aspartate) O-methyltransferase
LIDTYKLKGLRQKLVALLKGKGIQDAEVLRAIETVPRHAFVESAFAESAYEDRALPIQDGQTISQPFTVAYQTQLLQLKPNHKVLEIGTGSGYQAAVLCEMKINLFTIERMKNLHVRASQILNELNYKPRMKWGDGSAGWEMHAPFDRIIVTAASPDVPETLKKQLAIGGRMVIPVGDLETQTMILVEKKSRDEYTLTRLDQFKFVPMIGRFGWTEG